MKRTGGGRFGTIDRQVYMAAGTYYPEFLFPPVALESMTKLMTSDEILRKRIRDGQVVMLDSGIFSLTQTHMGAHPEMTMDDALALAPDEVDGFDELFTRYVEVVRKYEHDLWGYVELDQGGRENKIRTRARLEDMGLRPIPVYHPLNDGWDYFDELAGEYDRICVGNIVQASGALRARIIATIWERHRAYPHLWIHGLGYTPNALLHAWPLDSVDSSSWLGSVRWGATRRQVSANLELIADHHPDARYVLSDSVSMTRAAGVAAWMVHAASMQWQAHRDELVELGVESLPARLAQERVPCPSA